MTDREFYGNIRNHKIEKRELDEVMSRVKICRFFGKWSLTKKSREHYKELEKLYGSMAFFMTLSTIGFENVMMYTGDEDPMVREKPEI